MSNQQEEPVQRRNAVKTLEEYVKASYSKSLHDIYLEAVHGKIRLVDPNPPKTFREYITRLDYSLWVYAVIIIVVAQLVFTLEKIGNPIRLTTGIIFASFLPGYTLVQLLYPDERLSPIDILALSIGTSLAIISFIGLILNYSTSGLREKPFIIIISIIIIFITIISSYRKYKILKIK